MRLTELFVKRPTLVTVLLILIALAGTIGGLQLVRQQFPSAVVPSVEVVFSYPGASTSEMRDSIARPVEDQMAGAANLQHLVTTIQPGQATMVATFTLGSDPNNDLVQVQGRIQNAQHSLPNDVQAPQITVANPDEATVVTLAVSSSSRATADLSSVVTNKIVPSLEQLPGVSDITANGAVTPAIMINVDPNRMSTSGATITDVVSAITNNNVRAPGGILYSSNRETNLDVRGDIQDAKTAANLLVNGNSSASTGALDPWQTQSRLLRVGDVANVVDGYQTQRSYAFTYGKPCITLDIQKAAGTSEVTLSDTVLKALPDLRTQYPDIAFTVLNVQSTTTRDELNGVFRTLIEAILFTSAVMLFFLRSWRNAVVVALAIPASLLVTMAVMHVLNFSLDTVSLLAMTLIIGILVDDSIVVLENVERHLRMGESPAVAAIRGRSEIGLAAIVITLVDVVVFLPISFLPGSTGLFLREFGVVVTVATLTSLFISFTVTPTLAARWALLSTWKPWPVIEAFTERFEWLRTWYSQRALAGALRRRNTVALVSLVSLILAFSLIPLGVVGSELFPAVDRGEITVTLRFPSGTPLPVTRQRTLDAEAIVDDDADLQSESATAGAYLGAQSGFIADGAVGQIVLFLKPGRVRSTADTARALGTDLHKAISEAAVTAIPATNLDGGLTQPISLIVAARTGDPQAAAAQVAQALTKTPGTSNVSSTAAALSPQLTVGFDRERSRVLGAGIGVAATAVASAFGGDLATQFTGPDGLKNVLVTYPLADQNSVAAIGDIPIRGSAGVLHLRDILQLHSDPAPPMILRVDRADVVNVGANLASGAMLSNVQRDFQKRLARLRLPAGITVGPDSSGIGAELPQMLQGMGVVLLLSAALVYLLMVALYNDYRLPFIIMFAIPVAAVGALGALALRHETLNLFSLIGTVLLMGLVTKNGILLVDFAAREQREGADAATAIAGAARERFRPILMTTIAMIAGMLPLALNLDPGSAAAASLGTVVIGGLLSSLLLTLLLVPVVYMRAARGMKLHEPDAGI